MPNCKKCSKEFEIGFGLINFCSFECRNSRTWSDADKLKKSIASKNSDKAQAANENRKKNYTPDSEAMKKFKRTWEDKRNSRSFDSLSYETKRKIVLAEQNHSCIGCKNSEWVDFTDGVTKPIKLEVDHINGDRFDNRRENLRGLCPTCHAYTPTHAGRNKKVRLNEEEFVREYEKVKKISKALRAVGCTDKGHNYKRAKNILKKNNIEF